MIKLNLGCQIHYFDGWVNQDVVGDDPGIKTEIVCDAAKLPYKDGEVDFIYAGHLVEHYYPDTLPLALQEWFRVLKPEGKLVVVTPDCGAVMRDYAAGKFAIDSTWQQLYGRIYHYDAPSERHHIAFDHDMLVKMCIKEGFKWQSMDFRFPPEELVPFMDTHISRGAYQLGVILTK